MSMLSACFWDKIFLELLFIHNKHANLKFWTNCNETSDIIVTLYLYNKQDINSLTSMRATTKLLDHAYTIKWNSWIKSKRLQDQLI